MIILTAANTDKPKVDDHGKLYKKFSFRDVISHTVRQAHRYGYTPAVYDLGSLGMGEPFAVEDRSFMETGYYAKEPKAGYKSRSLFKPRLVKHCLSQHKKFTVYLDGDATLYGPIDEVQDDDYDIGVTLRKASDMTGKWYEEFSEIAGFVNAGVIFFHPTPATFEFIDKWEAATEKMGNDQAALNRLACPATCPRAGSILSINGVRVKYFPCERYNFYYFEDGLAPNIKIMHFKGNVRGYYPFTWSKRFYCGMVLPVAFRLRSFVRKFSSQSR